MNRSTESNSISISPKALALLIAVAALGYFVDVYDLLLFNVVRIASLETLGVGKEGLMSIGKDLQNWQAWGLLLGGFAWGIIGDIKGRRAVLFGSIILYSTANILNGFVATVWQYEVLRFVAGFGLAGELGAGIALISEVMSKEKRGLGTMLVALIGLLGAVAASIVGKWTDWRTAYFIGGGMGFALLVMRFGVHESGLFNAIAKTDAQRGNILMLFNNWSRFSRFALCALVGLPVYFIVGVLMAFAPELAKAMNLSYQPIAGDAVLWCYAAMSLGDLVCSGLSQVLGSRRIAFTVFHIIGLVGILLYLFHAPATLAGFYAQCALAGFGVGYWALITQHAAEQFGTNLRATVTTSVPNLVRAALIPINVILAELKPSFGLVTSATIVGLSCVTIGIVSVWLCRETFGRSLDFSEK